MMILLMAGLGLIFWLPVIVVICILHCMVPGLMATLMEYVNLHFHPVLAFLIDFSLAFIDFFGKLAYIVVVFCSEVFFKILTLFIEFVPTLFRVICSICQLFYWLLQELWNGISGHTDETTHIFSWIVVLSFVVIYLERLIRGMSLLQTRQRHVPTVIANVQPQNNSQGQNRSTDTQNAVGQGDDVSRNVEGESRPRHSQDQNQTLCIVCFEKDRDTAIFPCGHTHVCHHCIQSVIRHYNKCPICLGVIREFRKVYV